MLGSPIAHSLSPVLHRAAYGALGLDWTYEAIECDEGGLADVLADVRRDPRWAGLSLTMPLKTVAVGLCDEVRTGLGAVNTIVVTGDGLVGHNTDVDGIAVGLAKLVSAGADVSRIALLGAGGTARAAVEALSGAGTRQLTVHVRDAGRAQDVVALAEARGLAVEVVALTALTGPASGLTVVSTLPGSAGAALVDAGFTVNGPLLDVVYEPWPTALASSAVRAGRPVVGGLDVLVGQAARQVALMTGQPAPVAAMQQAGEAALAARAG